MRIWFAILLAAPFLSGCRYSDHADNPGVPVKLRAAAPSAPAPPPKPATGTKPGPVPDGIRATQLRLKAALARGRAYLVVPQAVEVSTAYASSYASPSVVGKDDPRVTWLGGKSASPTRYPFTQARIGQARTNGDPSVPGFVGLPQSRRGINNGIAFRLPGGNSEFELVLFDYGWTNLLHVAVDNAFVNDTGFDVTPQQRGRLVYYRVRLPPAAVSRKITLTFGSRPFVGLRLPANHTIGPKQVEVAPASAVFVGDSITAGSVAGQIPVFWPLQASYRLGITDPIVTAIGGSGYVARFPKASGFNFRERLNDDVIRAIPRGEPDAVFIAGGINDCFTRPEAAAATATNASAVFRRIREKLPNTVIFVIGPWTDYENAGLAAYEKANGACRDAIFGAARSVPYTYTIDVSTWVTASNKDRIFQGTAYGPHPVAAGHAIYGARVAAAVSAIIRSW